MSLGAMVAALAIAPLASAGNPPRPDEISAADAYRESLPTAAGPTPTGLPGRAVPFDARVAAKVGRGLLRDIVASPAYGASGRTLRPPAREDAAAGGSPDLPSLSAARTAVGDSVGRDRIVALSALLLGIGVAGAFARLRPARSTRR